jgi:hypothetical protein
MNILLMNTNHLLHGVITALLLVAKLLRMLAGRTHHQIRLKNKDRRLTVEVALLMDLVLFKQIYQEPIEEEVYWVAANKKRKQRSDRPVQINNFGLAVAVIVSLEAAQP